MCGGIVTVLVQIGHKFKVLWMTLEISPSSTTSLVAERLLVFVFVFVFVTVFDHFWVSNI